MYCTVLHCTVLYCIVLYCIVVYCTVLYCTVLYCTVLYCTVMYCTVLYCTVLRCTVLYCIVQCCAVLCCAVLYRMTVIRVASQPAHQPAQPASPPASPASPASQPSPPAHLPTCLPAYLVGGEGFLRESKGPFWGAIRSNPVRGDHFLQKQRVYYIFGLSVIHFRASNHGFLRGFSVFAKVVKSRQPRRNTCKVALKRARRPAKHA